MWYVYEDQFELSTWPGILDTPKPQVWVTLCTGKVLKLLVKKGDGVADDFVYNRPETTVNWFD